MFSKSSIVLSPNKMNFSNLLQKAFYTTQIIFAREAHVFNRAILKAKVRTHFPKPREVKRINVHGYAQRMATPTGRRVLMRNILKGSYCISH